MSLNLNSFLERPQRPPTLASPGVRLQPLFTLLLLFGLSGGLLAQDVCFDGLTAGGGQVACEGTIINLDGGYSLYDEPSNNPDLGLPVLTWVNPYDNPVTGGRFYLNNVAQPIGADVSAANFNNTANGITGFQDVSYEFPASLAISGGGVIYIFLQAASDDPASMCSSSAEAVLVGLDPIQNPLIDATIDGSTVIVGNSPDNAVANDGDEFDLEIQNPGVFITSEYDGAEAVVDVTITGADDITGFPTSQTALSVTDFNNLFNELTLTNETCLTIDFDIDVQMYYNRTEPECRGDVISFDFSLAPRPDAEATLAPVDEANFGLTASGAFIVCEDNTMVPIVVTGTPNSVVSYTVDYGDGSPTMGTLSLDDTGVDDTTLSVDASATTGADNLITVSLTAIEYDSDPACEQTLSETITFEVFPTPSLSLALVDPADEVICDFDGVRSFLWTVTTDAGPGNYTFVLQAQFEGFTPPPAQTVNLNIGPSGEQGFITTFNFNSGDFGRLIFTIDGTSITKNGVSASDLNCTSGPADSEVVVNIQPVPTVSLSAEGGDGPVALSNTGTDAGTITVCRGENLAVDLSGLVADDDVAPGTSPAVVLSVSNPNNISGLPADGTVYTNADLAVMDGSIDVSNTLATMASATLTFTPYFEDGADPVECSGDPVVLTVNVPPTPVVTITAADNLICSGSNTTITVTSSQAGTVDVIRGVGAPVETDFDVDIPNGSGGFTNTFTTPILSAEETFSVTFFTTTGPPACVSNVTATTTIAVEDNPTATLAIDDDYRCETEDGGSVLTFTGSGGTGADYTFDYTISGPAGTSTASVTTDAGEPSATVDLDGVTDAVGIYTYTLTNVTNDGGDDDCSGAVTGQEVTLTVEAQPTIGAIDDDNICSGDPVSIVVTSGTTDPSGEGSSLYFYLEVDDPTGGITTAGGIYAAEDGLTIEGNPTNMTAGPQDIEISVIAFYFPDADGTPTMADVAAACQSEEETATITVERVPTATFGGDETICEGDDANLVVTSTNNNFGYVLIRPIDSEDNPIGPDLTVTLDEGGEGSVAVSPAETTIYELHFISTDGPLVCTATSDFTFTVNVVETPEVAFTTPLNSTVCEGDDVTVSLLGTPGATVNITPDGDDAAAFDVTLGADGTWDIDLTEITRPDGATARTFTLNSISTLNGPLDVECGDDELEDEVTIEIELAPSGALMSNAVLCAGDMPQIQFNVTTDDEDYAGTYTVVVAGYPPFTGVSNGDLLDFGTLTLTETTTFVLESITKEGGEMCGDIATSTLVDATVRVNDVPEVTVAAFDPVVCSGTVVDFSATVSPTASILGDPTYLEVVVTDGFGSLAPGTYYVAGDDADDLNDALGITDVSFVNGSNDDPETVAFTVKPYYERDTDNPGDCSGLTEGFTGDFAEANWTTETTPTSSVTFSPDGTTLTLISAVDGANGAESDASAATTFTQDGTVSFAYEYDDESNSLFDDGFDIYLINAAGQEVFRAGDGTGLPNAGNGTVSVVVQAGDMLMFEIEGDLFNVQFRESVFIIDDFVFSGDCSTCEGTAVPVELTILPALFAEFDTEDATVCEGDQPEICISGTPGANVSVYVDGVFIDIKLEDDGTKCFTPVVGLEPGMTKYTITGVTTRPPLQECSFNYGAEGPMLTFTVTPTPKVTDLTIAPEDVCLGGMATATISGTDGAVVSYTVDGGATTEMVTISDDTDDDIDNPIATVVLPPDAAGTVTITLTGVEITVGGTTCPGMTGLTADLNVRELPTGTLTPASTACAGGTVDLVFTTDEDPADNDYTIVVTGPDPDLEDSYTAASGEVFLTVDVAGTYTVTSITNGFGCEATGTSLASADVIIDLDPVLTAAVSGTIGTGNLNSGTFINTFVAVGCNTSTLNTVFGTPQDMSDSGNPLYVSVQVVTNDDLIDGFPAGSTMIMPWADLDLSSILGNAGAADNDNVRMIITPYFEDDPGAPGLGDDCVGDPLTFDITILPEIGVDFDAAKNSADAAACEGGEVTIDLLGTAGGVVTFSVDNLTVISRSDDGEADNDGDDATVVLDDNGEGSITVAAGTAGTASLTIDMLVKESVFGGIPRTCMVMYDEDPLVFEVTVNENPMATISLSSTVDTIICNGESAVVTVTLVDTDYEAGDDFIFTVNGVDYPAEVDADGSAVLFTSGPLTEDSTFTLTLVDNDPSLCPTEVDAEATAEVEAIPGGTEGEDIVICANMMAGIELEDDYEPVGGESFVSVTVTDPVGFYGFDEEVTTMALSIEDFNGEFDDLDFNYVGGTPATVTVEVTYYIETDEDADEVGIDDGECVGATETFTITVNPRPQTVAVETDICSGVALDYDLDQAITNGVPADETSFDYEATVAGAIVASGSLAPGENLTDTYMNMTAVAYDVVYTVVPTTGDCEGNEFTLTVTVNPEPVITAEQEGDACSGEDIGLTVALSNSAILGTVTYELVSVMADFSADFVADGGNFATGATSTSSSFLSGDSYVNTSADAVVVTYTVQATSAETCVGAEETIEVTIYPIPVADPADLDLTICSSGTLGLDIVDSLTTNGVGTVQRWRRRVGNTVDADNIRIYDGGDDNQQVVFFPIGNGEFASSFTEGEPFIADSLVNDGTSDRVVFYDIIVENEDDDCEEEVFFTLAVTVVEEADVSLDLVDGQSAICDGSPIRLVANTSAGTGVFTFTYDVFSADAGVTINLTPSAAGGEVDVDGMGDGNAVIRVTAVNELGCVAEGFRTVSVSDVPEVLEIVGPDAPCTGVTNFYDVANDPTSTYVWSISNPAAAQFIPDNTTASVDIIFNTSAGFGPFILSVTETNAAGCSTTSELEVTLADETFADFTFSVDGREVTFTDASGGSVMGYEWSYDDGSGPVVFSNNPDPVLEFPGSATSYAVTLSVAGMCAASVDGIASVTKTVSLDPSAIMDVIELKRGTNFISFDVMFTDRSPSSVFAGAQGLQSVSTFENGVAKLYDPSRPPFANSLREVKDDYGYIVVVDRDQTLTVTGLPVSPTFQRPLDDGINYIGHCAPNTVPSSQRLAVMEAANQLIVARTFGRNVTPNVQNYVPGRPAFAQSLKNFYNGVGYAVITNDVVGGQNRESNGATESYDFVFGTVSGASTVEILNEAGEVIGQLNTNADGTFSATPLYGKVERPNGIVDGALELDEKISFRANGKVIESDIAFHGEFAGEWVDLDFSDAAADQGLTATVFPNPAGEQTTVSITTTEVMNVEVVAMDVNGRAVAKLLSNQELPAGTTRIEWNTLGQLPAGMYHIVITRDGAILSNATQRVIKR